MKNSSTDPQFDEKNYEQLVKQILSKMPSLSTVARDLAYLLNEDANIGIAHIEELLIRDQTLAVRVLRVANGPFFREGNDERISSLGEAILRIGIEQIKQIVLSFSVFKLFRSEKDEEFDVKGLWVHSHGVASISRRLAEFLGFGKEWGSIAYTSGMIHDIGKVARFRLDKFEHTESLAHDSRLALLDSINFKEAEILNQSVLHDYLGYVLCKSCDFIGFTQDVVRWHHEPEPRSRNEMSSEESHYLVDIVIVANWLTHQQRFGFSGHKIVTKPSDFLFERLGLDQAKLESLQQTVPAILESTKSFNDIVL